jgi:uroporphyrinogen-III synthase
VNDPLVGCRVLVTRERPGELARLLAARGAIVQHVPLIATVDVDGDELGEQLAQLPAVDWLVVTSVNGAERVGAAAAAAPGVRLAAVGTATAATLAALAGRPVDVVPSTQHAGALVEALLEAAGPPPRRFLVAQADRAMPTLVDGLRAAGHTVTPVVAYRTELRPPPAGVVEGADALLLASGSAAEAWVATMGAGAPPIVVSIGPTTTAVAQELGLKVDATATDHTLSGLVSALCRLRSVPESDRTHPAK